MPEWNIFERGSTFLKVVEDENSISLRGYNGYEYYRIFLESIENLQKFLDYAIDLEKPFSLLRSDIEIETSSTIERLKVTMTDCFLRKYYFFIEARELIEILRNIITEIKYPEEQ